MCVNPLVEALSHLYYQKLVMVPPKQFILVLYNFTGIAYHVFVPRQVNHNQLHGIKEAALLAMPCLVISSIIIPPVSYRSF